MCFTGELYGSSGDLYLDTVEDCFYCHTECCDTMFNHASSICSWCRCTVGFVRRITLTPARQHSNIIDVTHDFTIYHLPLVFRSLRKEEPLPEMFPQTPVPSYSWPRSTHVADKIVSPSCFWPSLPSCPFSWCPLCHSFSPSVVVESCNVSCPSMYSLLDDVYDVIYTCLMSYPPMTNTSNHIPIKKINTGRFLYHVKNHNLIN